ncbi:MAG: hypothetical protein H9993_02815 [Candidatus Desulfovibrio faecigallinarum]|nr:hypothetical protein [Candidatus Desulfovibrio faecigallinarum]
MRVRTLSFFACLVTVLSLACAPLAQADKLETKYYTVDLSDTWQQLQNSDEDTLDIIVLATKNRDCILTTINGRSGGASLKTITQCFAQQYQSKGNPSVKSKLGSFTFKDVNGDDGIAYVTVQDQVYMVVTISGNQRKGKSLLKNFSSDSFPDLVPSI